jgi:hypothetical protein
MRFYKLFMHLSKIKIYIYIYKSYYYNCNVFLASHYPTHQRVMTLECLNKIRFCTDITRTMQIDCSLRTIIYSETAVVFSSAHVKTNICDFVRDTIITCDKYCYCNKAKHIGCKIYLFSRGIY